MGQAGTKARWDSGTAAMSFPTNGGHAAVAAYLVRLGRYDDAERVMAEHPGDLMEVLPSDHHERQLYLRTLAEIDECLGRPVKAVGRPN